MGALFVAGALADAEVDVSLEALQGCTPGRSTFNSIIDDTAADRLYDIIAKIRDNPHCYIIVDKANSDKAGAKSATFPKMLSFVDRETRSV